MAAEESSSDSLAQTHQQRRRYTTLFNASKQGEVSNNRDIMGPLMLIYFFFKRLLKDYIPFLTPCLHQGSIWSYCVNEEVLRLGLARTSPIVGVLPDSPLYWRLHKRLHRAEVRAEKKGLGMWRRDSLWERVSKAVGDSALFRLMRRIFKRT